MAVGFRCVADPHFSPLLTLNFLPGHLEPRSAVIFAHFQTVANSVPADATSAARWPSRSPEFLGIARVILELPSEKLARSSL